MKFPRRRQQKIDQPTSLSFLLEINETLALLASYNAIDPKQRDNQKYQEILETLKDRISRILETTSLTTSEIAQLLNLFAANGLARIQTGRAVRKLLQDVILHYAKIAVTGEELCVTLDDGQVVNIFSPSDGNMPAVIYEAGRTADETHSSWGYTEGGLLKNVVIHMNRGIRSFHLDMPEA